MESLFELWGKRNPEWEKRYQSTIIDVFTDYGKGVNQYQDIRGKIFGAGYEIIIIAFFIGLYYDQTKPLVEDKSKRKVLGQAIMYWGNIENKLGRNSYGKIREYIFAALVTRTDIDLVALDKGEITARSVVDALIMKMEQYINFGLDYIEEQLENDPNYFFKETAFLRIFTSFLSTPEDKDEQKEGPDPLDMETVSSEDTPEPLEMPDTDVPGDEETMRAKAERPWNDDEIERLVLYHENNIDISRIAEKMGKSIYSVQFQLAKLGVIKMPLNVSVRNSQSGGSIINKSGEVIYTDEALLKIINGQVFRFNLKPMCLTVKEVKRHDGEWVKTEKKLVAYADSALFPQLSRSDLVDEVEDFREGETREQNRIKVKGSWYDYYGDRVLDNNYSGESAMEIDRHDAMRPFTGSTRWSVADKNLLSEYKKSGMTVEMLARFFKTTEDDIRYMIDKLNV